MLAATLKQLQDAETKADKILAQANLAVTEIEKRTYQEIAQIQAQTNQEIAAEIAALPKSAPLPDATVNLEVPQNKMAAAVEYITTAFYGA